MSAFLSHLSPIPSFPAYSGPYKVGTQDVEIPVSQLSSPTPSPDPSITTISFRLFYPYDVTANAPAKKSVHWLPDPQANYFQAYMKFLGSSPRLASLLSFLPILRPIFWTTIPAIRDGNLASPIKGSKRWPVMVFSHGLGGTRNGYSVLCGSLASHGMVVVAPEHRDGSAPISMGPKPLKGGQKPAEYRHLPHNPPKDLLRGVEDERMQQLKIRCWELGLVHDALLRFDKGEDLSNLAATSPQKSRLSIFTSTLDVHTPGKISWSGHSFGAATVIQFVKSVFYPPDSTTPADYKSLYNPPRDSPMTQQINASTPTILLDLWAIPLSIPRLRWLWKKPLPAYTSPDGSPPLAILSEAFFKWKGNFEDTKRVIALPKTRSTKLKPLVFYPISSAHLSQSDFGLLYPYLTRKFMKALDPERTMRLNVRAILESLRRCNINVADTSSIDLEITENENIGIVKALENRQRWPLGQDHKILATDEGMVRGWVNVNVGPELDVGMPTPKGFADEEKSWEWHVANGEDGDAGAADGDVDGLVNASSPGEAVVKGEMMKD